MNRRDFLRGLGVSLVAAGVAPYLVTEEILETKVPVLEEYTQYELTGKCFQNMLRAYLPTQIIREELMRTSHMYKAIKKDKNWQGQLIPLPLKGV